jgi:hypothetical protein
MVVESRPRRSVVCSLVTETMSRGSARAVLKRRYSFFERIGLTCPVDDLRAAELRIAVRCRLFSQPCTQHSIEDNPGGTYLF